MKEQRHIPVYTDIQSEIVPIRGRTNPHDSKLARGGTYLRTVTYTGVAQAELKPMARACVTMKGIIR